MDSIPLADVALGSVLPVLGLERPLFPAGTLLVVKIPPRIKNSGFVLRDPRVFALGAALFGTICGAIGIQPGYR